jgi:hypothetical protein
VRESLVTLHNGTAEQNLPYARRLANLPSAKLTTATWYLAVVAGTNFPAFIERDTAGRA